APAVVQANSSGVAAFTALGIQTAAPSYSLTGYVCSNSSGCNSGNAVATLVSSSFAVNAAAASTTTSSFTTAPASSVVAGNPFSATVTILDTLNNAIAGKYVTLEVTGGTPAISGGSPTVQTNSSGQAAFSGVSITQAS